MTGFFLRCAIVALGLWLATKMLPGLQFDTAGTLLAAALLLGIVNAVIRPIAIVLTLPLTLVTLGLFPDRDQCRDARTRRAPPERVHDQQFLDRCRRRARRQRDFMARVGTNR